jgi:hypothetical protein
MVQVGGDEGDHGFQVHNESNAMVLFRDHNIWDMTCLGRISSSKGM